MPLGVNKLVDICEFFILETFLFLGYFDPETYIFDNGNT